MIEVKITGNTVEELATQALQFSGPFAAYMVTALQAQQEAQAAQPKAATTNGAVAPVPPEQHQQVEDFPPSDNVGAEPVVDYDYETHVKPRASAVVKKIGMEATKQLLQKEFGVKRPVELRPEHFAEFMSQTEKFV